MSGLDVLILVACPLVTAAVFYSLGHGVGEYQQWRRDHPDD